MRSKYSSQQIFEALPTFIMLSIAIVCLSGCKKFVDVGAPITSSNMENVYTNDATATSVLTGMYITLSNAGLDNNEINGITLLAGLSADELQVINTDESLLQYYNNTLSPATTSWANYYAMVFNINAAIEGITSSTSLTPSVRSQLLGEAKFLRAFCYFHLVNLYGDTPLALSTDFKVNSSLTRTGRSSVYQQIITDLEDARELLNENYVSLPSLITTAERVRPNRSAATALLSRVYLYTKEYAKAESLSTTLIENNAYELVSLDNAFLMNNKEAIWQLQNVGLNANANTKEGAYFIPLTATLNERPTYLTENLYQSFEVNDKRRDHWINSILINSETYYYTYKYKIGAVATATSEYSTVLRLAEQYLIRAEARIQLNKVQDGIADLNSIRHRATDLSALPEDQLPQLSLNLNKEQAILAIEKERQHELFTEWGHRWFDLKRRDRADVVLKSLKGTNWQITDQLFPIPQLDMDRNPNLAGHQNPGY
jgi:hypothetical protein